VEFKKLFVDCHVFDGNFQGTTTYIKGLYTELLKDKRIHFFFGASNIEAIKQIFGTHDNLTYVSYSSRNKFYRLLFDIPRIIKKNQIDYAHFQYVVPPIKNCKFIVTIHDVLFLDFPEYFPFSYRLKNYFLFKQSAQKSDIVLTVSDYSKIRIQHHFKLKKVSVTANAVDLTYFESYNKEQVQQEIKSKFNVADYFLYVSRWEPRKNHHTLLKVFVENKHFKKHKLVFVGNKAIENKEYDAYYDLLPKEIKEHVFVFNEVNFKDLVTFVRGADLAIYPSIGEGFGIPPLESLAAGIPTVCSNTTAMSDFFFLNTLQFDPLNETKMNTAIVEGLTDPDVQKRSGQMQAKYNWQNTKSDFIKAIKDFEGELRF
jgi:glycosyltransferase involved in cell wall biosynthesis